MRSRFEAVISRKDAKAQGMKRYFTGKPCRRGHIADRFVSTRQCSDCKLEDYRQWRSENREAENRRCREYYRNNRDRALEYAARYRRENREKIARYGAEYRRLNRGKIASRMRVYRLANRDRLAEQSRRYKEENRERLLEQRRQYHHRNKKRVLAAWRKRRAQNLERARAQERQRYAANPEMYRAKQRRRRARKHNAPGFHTDEDVRRIYQRQHGRCAGCDQRLKGRYHTDHIVPLARGGSDDPSNLQILCPFCNRSKGAKCPFKWAQENGRLL